LYGCVSPQGAYAPQISYGGTEYLDCTQKGELCYTPPDPPYAGAGFPCYEHPTMTDLLDTNGFNGQSQISWEYYGVSMKYIWDAPDAIDDICQPEQVNGVWKCTGVHFTTNTNANGQVYLGNPAQIFNDISSCNLANVSWVIPYGQWSDHSGNSEGWDNLGYGPSWVADIVDAVGENAACQGTKELYWNDTVILITWDDWGGYSDHVLPYNCDSGGNCIGYGTNDKNTSGQYYVYGFRVPLLVVSAYTPPGYVSGPVSDPNNLPTACPKTGTLYPYCHDFGSILNFIEYVFGSNGSPLPEIDNAYPYHYADYWAPDGPKGPLGAQYSLSDFFNFPLYQNNPRTFLPITSAPLPASFFLTYNADPTGPDDD